jgi:hypothetical protein
MGTRALIGYLDTNQKPVKLISTYNHYDGYPENLGKGLETFYGEDEAAKEIASVGYISYLDGDTGEWEAKNKQQPTVATLADNFNEAMIGIAEEIDSFGADFGYIWDGENEEWITVKNQGIRSMAQSLEMNLAHLKDKFAMMPERPDQTMENKNKMKEGYYGTTNVENYIQTIGYESFEEFFNDNPGGEEALISWIESIPEFRKMLMRQGMLDDNEEEEIDENFINKMKYRAGIIK